MEIEHEETMRDGVITEEYFWLNGEDGTRNKILQRDEMIAAAEYVKANPEKFKTND